MVGQCRKNLEVFSEWVKDTSQWNEDFIKNCNEGYEG